MEVSPVSEASPFRDKIYQENMIKESGVPVKIDDKTTSDVVVRLRTQEGRDDWFYCHSQILTEKSKYFADRLSEDWPTCQILDCRSCVEVYCDEPEFNFHVNALRLLYVTELNTWHGVRNALGILQVAVRLGCHEMADACASYLEAVPWEEAEEEEILKTVPCLGSHYQSILARLQPVEPTAVIGTFMLTIRFATSSPSSSMCELKSSAQEQLEYMLTEDDDTPLLATSDTFKSEVRKCVEDLFSRFNELLQSLLNSPLETTSEADKIEFTKSFLSDLSWACQILGKMELMKDLVNYWVNVSGDIVKAVECLKRNGGMTEVELKVVEVAGKVLEAIGYGHVILPTSKRLHMVKVWLPFVQRAKALVDSIDPNSESDLPVKADSEIWQGLESAFVSIVLALPSGDQADILAEWLKSEHARFPDLSEAFEVWCYRSKVARSRLAFLEGFKSDGITD